MKEKLYTIPLQDAIAAETECPLCYIEQKIESDALDFVLGTSASYMERDVRAVTDEKGFCRRHFQKMFEYGNSLGNGWILKTHYMRKMKELQEAFCDNGGVSRKRTFLSKGMGKKEGSSNPVVTFAKKEQESCYICEQMKKDYRRYLETFVYLYINESDFHDKVLKSKGFCVKHLGDLCETADTYMKAPELTSFYSEIEELMMRNLERTFEDVSWLIEKYDYRNREADWKQSKDAVPRAMQKLKGTF